MLVTFTTNAYSDITMFGTAAVALLKLMGQSGNVPGAIMAEDVHAALARLNDELQRISAEQPVPDQSNANDDSADDDKEAAIGLDKRAGPLVELLEAAIAAEDNVLWSE